MACSHLTRLVAGLWLGIYAVPALALELRPCQLSGSQGYPFVNADCGYLARPENPLETSGRSIELFVARLTATGANPGKQAFTIINGGPGASSVSLYVDLAEAFSGILGERDIVLVDQRGTGRSNALECPQLSQATQAYSRTAVQEATRSCLQTLTADPGFYSTTQAVADLDAVREALDYQALDIYGVSYGTRVALHYLRRHPDRVRSLIIDGVVPPGLALGVNVAENAQASLARTFDDCRNDTQCARAFGDIGGVFRQLVARLKQHPVALTVAHPVTGKRQPFELGYEHLAMTIRLLSYAPETIALIPLIIQQTSMGNYTPVASQAMRIMERLTADLAFGMHNSVVCTEDIPFVAPEQVDWQALEQTYLGADQVRALQDICELWPKSPMDDDLHQPLHTEIPVLVLSGERDPITPPAYGQRVADMLGNALHIVGNGQGHGLISRGCLPRLAADFVKKGDWQGLDISCVSRLDKSPFFLDLLGPSP